MPVMVLKVFQDNATILGDRIVAELTGRTLWLGAFGVIGSPPIAVCKCSKLGRGGGNRRLVDLQKAQVFHIVGNR